MNPSFGDAYRDTSVAHAGVASYKTHLNGAYFGQFGLTDCIAPPPTAPGKTVTMSFWYLTTDTRITSIELSDRYWSTAACSGSGSGSIAQASAPLADGQWHQVTGASPAYDTPSLDLRIGFLCTSACPGAEVNFDDVIFEQSATTAATVTHVRSTRTRSGVLLRWRTASESQTLGFNVYRQRNGKLLKLNRTLIPSVFGATTTGHAYSWLDRHPSGAATRYRVQAVGLDGTRTWVGSAHVAAG